MSDASNTNPSGLSIADFSYDLPEDRIAKYPLAERDHSKLLMYKSGEISEERFSQLPSLLHPNDCLVFNNTRVVHARMQFQRQTGARIEIFCLEPIDPVEVSEAFAQRKTTTWKAIVGNSKRLKIGEVLSRNISIDGIQHKLKAELCSKENDSFTVKFSWDLEASFAEVLENAGTLPLPPYLNRETESEDEERYQTVYAEADGSVAAPTAGLHFTKSVFDNLKDKGIEALFVTLHVGAGTFMPVKSDTMQDHEMHQERISVSINAIKRMRNATMENRIIAVGTTSIRTIESIYWFGVKLLSGYDMKELFVGQWEPYQLKDQSVSVIQSLDAVLDWMKNMNLDYLNGATQLLIAPGYRIRMVDALITNFHQPQSTLLLLVAALVGDDWRKIYDHALGHDFRFLSFGDSSILFRE
ncbi:S-adenosylmethionine:tRNA ribosyltransferase-isomerase [Salibacteraceae bacterium]|nr:S-adenosylmethionine:tRNA ribosyltransferase-isomerase [Salibacteraceae bacterium]